MPGCKRLKVLVLQDNNDIMEINHDFEESQKVTGSKKKMSRAEKSRRAAKMRRDKENIEVENLMQLLPFKPDTLAKLDKNSVMEIILNYINTKQYVQKEMAALSLNSKDKLKENELQKQKACSTVVNCCDGVEVEESTLMLEAMNGFLILLDKKKNIMFVSEGVEKHLGIEQVSMLGKSLKHFIHPNDIPELRKQFNMKVCGDTDDCKCKFLDFNHSKENDTSNGTHSPPHLDNNRLFYLRMKYFLKKGGSRTRHSGYTLIQWSGRLKMRTSSKPNGYTVDGLICICRPMQTNSVLEIRMDGNMFMSRHDLGMKFTFCDPRIITLIGYQPHEVIGKTAYQFHNPVDAPKVSICHSNLIVKGTSVSKYYRFIGKNCDWVWVQTRATIIYNTSNVPQYIVCMNYIISEEEGQQYLLMEQEQPPLPATNARGAIESTCSSSSSCDHHSDAGYSSSHSPYSSLHASPCPMEAQHSTDAHATDSAVSDGNFPVNVFQEVANTINSGTDEEVIEFLDILEKEGRREKEKLYASQSQSHREVQPLGQTHSQPYLLNSLNQSQSLQQTSQAQALDDIHTDQHNVQSSRQSLVCPQQSVLQSLLTPLTSQSNGINQHGTVQGILSCGMNANSYQQDNSALTNPARVDVSQTVGSPQAKMSSANSSPMNILSDESQEPIDFISADISDPLISDASIYRDDGSQISSPPAGGLMNVHIGLLNSADLMANPQNGDSLPKEITDFCMQYCNSLLDGQANQLISEFGHSSLMAELDQLSNQSGSDISCSSVPFTSYNSVTDAPNTSAISTPSCSSNNRLINQSALNTSAFQQMASNMLQKSSAAQRPPSGLPNNQPQCAASLSEGFQPSAPITSSQPLHTADLLNPYPLSVGKSLTVPCTNGVSNQVPVSQINGHSRLYPQQSGGPWSCSSSLQSVASTSNYNHNMASHISPAPSTAPSFANSPLSPTATNLSSPLSSVTSPFSPQTPGGLSQINSPMDHCHLSPYSPMSPNGINHSVLPESTFSQSIVNSQPQLCSTIAQSTNTDFICGRNGINSTATNSAHQVMNGCVNNPGIVNGEHSDKQRMSELEKMLRGYSSPSHIFSGRGQSCSQQIMSEGGNNGRMTSKSTLLQQMLTGQLSGEMYHAMERKQRNSDSTSRNVQQ